jgi:hypothetical protein
LKAQLKRWGGPNENPSAKPVRGGRRLGHDCRAVPVVYDRRGAEMSTRQEAAMKAIGKEVNLWMKKTLEETNIKLAYALDDANQLRTENLKLKQKLKALRVSA